MTEYVIPAWELPSVPVAGTTQRFPVRHVYCVGRNYAEHAKEMGGDATKEPPFFFTKPADAIVARAEQIGAQLIVIASHGHGGFRRFLLGSTAERVVRMATVPVLTVHAEDAAP